MFRQVVPDNPAPCSHKLFVLLNVKADWTSLGLTFSNIVVLPFVL